MLVAHSNFRSRRIGTQCDHFYTTSDAERNNAIANSAYQSEAEACFVYDGDPLGTKALYRLFHPFSR
jgi:Repeat of unknown function (DUF5648)